MFDTRPRADRTVPRGASLGLAAPPHHGGTASAAVPVLVQQDPGSSRSKGGGTAPTRALGGRAAGGVGALGPGRPSVPARGGRRLHVSISPTPTGVSSDFKREGW